jgi:hypothetical protein
MCITTDSTLTLTVRITADAGELPVPGEQLLEPLGVQHIDG